MKLRRSRRRRAAILLVSMCAVLAIGCGSESNSSSSGSSSGTSDSAQASAATAAVEKASAPVQFAAPGPAFDVSTFRGKTLYFVTIDSVPFIERAYAAMKEAGRGLGIQVREISGRGQTSGVADGIEQAIAAKAGAILVGATAFKYIPQAVKAANDAKIPLVGLLNISSGQPIPQGSQGEVTLDYRLSGEQLVAYAVANTKDPVNAVYAHIPAVDTFIALKQGIDDGFAKYCPDCKHDSFDAQQATLKQQMESKTQAEIRREPKLNWIFPAIDLMAQFGVPAVQAVGKADSVRIGSINAVEANLRFIQEGKVQAADVGNNNSWMGYAAMDRLMRAMAGDPPAKSVIPIRLFDAANLKGKDIANEDELFGVDYRAEYRKLWQAGQ